VDNLSSIVNLFRLEKQWYTMFSLDNYFPMKNKHSYFNKDSFKYFLGGFLIAGFFIIAFSQVGAIVDVERPQGFLGSGNPQDIIHRIGSLTIGSASVSSWLSKTNGRTSCINKNTTSEGNAWGLESCLDVVGGAVFDSIVVHQPAYLNGNTILNSRSIDADDTWAAHSSCAENPDPNSDPRCVKPGDGLIVGNTVGGSHVVGTNNGVIATGLGRFLGTKPRVRNLSTHRYLCASGNGELFACAQGAVETNYSWQVVNCAVVCQDTFGNVAADANVSCTNIKPAVPNSCQPPVSNAEYRLDACAYTGENSAIDSLGNNNATVNSGLATIDSQWGRAASFYGSANYLKYDSNGFVSNTKSDYGISLPDNLRFEGTFTYAGWFRTNEEHQIDSVTDGGNAGRTGQNRTFAVAAEPEWYYDASAGYHRQDTTKAGSGISYATNGVTVYEATQGVPARIVHVANLGTTWNHVAVTYEDSVPSLYVNGQFISTTTSNKIVYAPVQFGHSAYGTFNGQVDEFKVYDSTLTATEVGILYDSEVNATRASSCTASEYEWRWSSYRCYDNDFLFRESECYVLPEERLVDRNFCPDPEWLASEQQDTGSCIPTWQWQTGDWGGCSNGKKWRDVKCMVDTFDSDGSYEVASSECEPNGAGTKPESSTTNGCEAAETYSWYAHGWEVCSNSKQYRAVDCHSSISGHSVSDSYCAGTKPDTSRTVDCGAPPPGSCSGTYNVATGGSCSGDFSTTGEECSGGTFTYLRETGQYPDVDQAQSACAAQGLGIHACQSGYNCSNNEICPNTNKTASCSSLNTNICGKEKSEGQCSVTTIPASCGGGNYTYQVETGIYADSTTALNACGEDLGLHGCDSGYNCADNTYCPLEDRSGSCSGKSETSCGSSAEFGDGTCSWTDAPTKSHSCSGIDQSSCTGTCSWSTGSETVSCTGLDQSTCSSKGCTWS